MSHILPAADGALSSKLLVVESDRGAVNAIRSFCNDHGLTGLRVGGDNVLQVLASNVDLGGVTIAEKLDGIDGVSLGLRIRALRPELPLFLRRDARVGLDDLPERAREAFATAYTLDDIAALKPEIDRCIFGMVYPNRLVRGIAEITAQALECQFKGLDVTIKSPYVVRDRLIFGELFTLIPIESSWCRGYMMLQTEEGSLQRLIAEGRTYADEAEAADFRSVNMVLGEITNLVWGAFKNRYRAEDDSAALYLSQVPIVVNHAHRYISFGSTDPQLCFRCVLTDPTDPELPPVVIHQRFVFNLNWSPEDFRENDVSVDNLVASGDLEMF